MAYSRVSSSSKRKQPAKSPRTKKGRAASSEEHFPRFDVPYFAHDALNPKIYPPSVCQPVGGPCATNTMKQRDEEDFEGTLEEISSDDGDISGLVQTSASSSRKQHVSPAPTTPDYKKRPDYKKVRVQGGRLAMPKKVVWNLDSDDEIIVKMKQEKYSDKEVVERLIKEGRTKYHHKTISSRWVRLKRVLAAHEEELLDEQLTDWHDGEDALLLEAVALADREIYRRKQKVAGEKWKIVADHLKTSKLTTNYSKNACRKRFEALEDGTATIPPELADKPEERLAERAMMQEKRAAARLKASEEETVADTKADASAANSEQGKHSYKAAGGGFNSRNTPQGMPKAINDLNMFHLSQEDMVTSDKDTGMNYDQPMNSGEVGSDAEPMMTQPEGVGPVRRTSVAFIVPGPRRVDTT